MAMHPSSSPRTSYTTQTNPSKSTKTKPSYLIIVFNKLCLLFFAVMPKNLFPPSISLSLPGGESLGYMSLKWDLSKFPTTLTFLPPLSEGQLQRDIKRARRMRVEEDILRLPSCRMKPWLRKLSKIATLPILRLLKKLHPMFQPRQ